MGQGGEVGGGEEIERREDITAEGDERRRRRRGWEDVCREESYEGEIVQLRKLP